MEPVPFQGDACCRFTGSAISTIIMGAGIAEPLSSCMVTTGKLRPSAWRHRGKGVNVGRIRRMQTGHVRRLSTTSCFLLSSLGVWFSVVSLATAQQPAFPGAEGFGAFALGGRSGTVYHVTNLSDTGSGSFRDAVSVTNRTVVFDVSGIINLGSKISITKSNITVACQRPLRLAISK